ncbi:hypothetical protein CRG98_048502 [Punica granatum]|uniref:Uncharacterized protein n=1 Tax=Punica granatum TaxID=22663 RepID=A0A2I0HHK8_PUNGR|nr:hypothetical protein CRG98_048502 [Punica granatum]
MTRVPITAEGRERESFLPPFFPGEVDGGSSASNDLVEREERPKGLPRSERPPIPVSLNPIDLAGKEKGPKGLLVQFFPLILDPSRLGPPFF